MGRVHAGDFCRSATSRAKTYWNIIQIVIGGVIAILILLFIWRMAECAGLMRMGMIHAVRLGLA